MDYEYKLLYKLFLCITSKLKKMKYIYILSTFITCTISFAQIGINTELPLGSLHVDPQKNNKTVDANKFTDDFIIVPSGNVGIGTIQPNTKLEIFSDSFGALKIVDGTQKEGNVLTSNENGTATWKTLPNMKSSVLANYPSQTITVKSKDSGYSYLEYNITLTKGKWMIFLGATVRKETPIRRWIQIKFASSSTNVNDQTGFTFLTPGKENSAIGGVLDADANPIPNHGNLNFINGSVAIDVLVDNITIYPFLQNFTTDEWVHSNVPWENYFYAIPIK
ncbi:hypothetical protein BK054_16740 [Myroides sp. ZB35]|nr:hypothetical protein BK054_16740 [Myroides sp. ZB35]EKB05730.1 hypothetical protein HMPREF9711_01109 [Myroides odoratimimus CCUG 3837]